MNREKDILSIWKERITQETKYGDKKKACNVAGTTPTTYLTALKKESLEDLTDGELRTLTVLITILDERKEKLTQIHQQYEKA